MTELIDRTLDLFLRRLLIRSKLSGDEQEAIRSLPCATVPVAAHREFVRPGQKVAHVSFVADGLAARFDLMRDGSRAIAELFVPGDACDLPSLIAPRAGWGLVALGASTVVTTSHASLRELVGRYPEIGMAFWRDSTADAGGLAKWVGNIGRKVATARLAHLFCEMGRRMEATGLGTRESYPLNATQEQIGDAMGLTSVHVNRTLLTLREAGAVTFQSRRVEVMDWDRLADIAEFDELFLLLDQPESARLIA